MRKLIVVPTEKELDFLRAAGTSRGVRFERARIGRIQAHYDLSSGTGFACGGLGKAEFALRSRHLLDHSESWVLICAGAAGALDPQLQVGDVVAATETVEHDFRNRFSDRPSPRFPASPELIEAIRQVPQQNDFRVHFGPIAGGDEDVVDLDRAAGIRGATSALAVAWEGPGGARAASFSQVSYLELRAVTDLADAAAPDSYDQQLELAMANLWQVLSSGLRAARP